MGPCYPFGPNISTSSSAAFPNGSVGGPPLAPSASTSSFINYYNLDTSALNAGAGPAAASSSSTPPQPVSPTHGPARFGAFLSPPTPGTGPRHDPNTTASVDRSPLFQRMLPIVALPNVVQHPEWLWEGGLARDEELVSLINKLCKKQKRNLHQVNLTIDPSLWHQFPGLKSVALSNLMHRFGILKKFNKILQVSCCKASEPNPPAAAVMASKKSYFAAIKTPFFDLSWCF